jgi:hypothetical protein
MGCIVVWHKRYISFDSESDSNCDDADEREDPNPLPQRGTSPLPQREQSSSPPPRTRKFNSSNRIGSSHKEASKAPAKKN